eukprot:scaffold1046_cov118-Isochrysis_galbana.AAC.14
MPPDRPGCWRAAVGGPAGAGGQCQSWPPRRAGAAPPAPRAARACRRAPTQTRSQKSACGTGRAAGRWTGIAPRRRRRSALTRRHAQRHQPTALLLAPTPAPPDRQLLMPPSASLHSAIERG